MSPLTAPTDNLYKFLAIFGLIVTMFSVYVPLQHYIEYGRVTSRFFLATLPLGEREIAISRAGAIEAICTAAKAHSPSEPAPSDGKTDEFCKGVPIASAAASAAKEGIDKLREQVRPLEAQRDLVWQEFAIYLQFGIGGVVLGIAMTIAGFVLWYFKLQRYLDAAVKADAMPARRRVGKP